MTGTFTVLSVIMPAFYIQNKVLLILKGVTANPINPQNTQLAQFQYFGYKEVFGFFFLPTSIHFMFSPS